MDIDIKEKIKNGQFISIAMTTYNGEVFLEKQIDSILAQTHDNFELVISDDKSTDATLEILKRYATQDERIKFSVNPNPSGFKKNFERAIKLCRGDIVFLCDQDDVWYSDKIKTHLEKYYDKSVMWVYNEARLVDKNGGQIGFLTDDNPNYYAKKKLLYNTWGTCVIGCVTSYRAKRLQNIWPIDPYAPGHDAWIQLAIFPAKSYHLPLVLQDYRQHDKNLFGTRPSKSNVDKDISDNFRYLWSLSMNRRIQIWKRCFFFVVLIAKYVRLFFTRIFSSKS